MDITTLSDARNLVDSWGVPFGTHDKRELVATDVYRMYQHGLTQGRAEVAEGVLKERRHVVTHIPEPKQSDWFEIFPGKAINLAVLTHLHTHDDAGRSLTVFVGREPCTIPKEHCKEILRRLGVKPLPPSTGTHESSF